MLCEGRQTLGAGRGGVQQNSRLHGIAHAERLIIDVADINHDRIVRCYRHYFMLVAGTQCSDKYIE